MRDEQVLQNTTSKIVTLTLRSATTGQFITDAVAGDCAGDWAIAGGTTAALSFSVGTEGDSYSSGKFCPRADGSYDWHVPNSLLTTLGQVVATISVTDCIDTRVEFQVVAVDRETAVYGAAVAGDEMDLVDAPNSTAVSAIQDGLSTFDATTDDVNVGSIGTDAITADSVQADAIGASEIAASASAEIADLIAADWVAGDASPLAIVAALKADAQWSNLATLQADVSSILEDTGTTIPALLPSNFATLSITTGNIAGTVGGIAGTINTLDALGTALDAAHGDGSWEDAGGGGGSATLENQESILAAIQGSEVIQTASPNVQGNLVLTQGDDYDGTANPKAQWTVSVDYTDGWSVAFTIRDSDDAVVLFGASTKSTSSPSIIGLREGS